MQTLLDGVRARIELTADCEITMEANPGTVEADKFAGFQRAGINRISIGVQSFQQEKLTRPYAFTARKRRARPPHWLTPSNCPPSTWI